MPNQGGLKPSITTAVVFFAIAVLLVTIAFPFFKLIAQQTLVLSNSSSIYTTTQEEVQIANYTYTLNQPKYYTQQYNILVTLYTIVAYPFFDIVVFAMLVGLGFIYWFMRERD